MDLNELKKQIANNKTENVIDTLIGFLSTYDSDKNAMVISLSAKWKDIKKKVNIGIIDNSEATRNQSQINYAILDLINELEKELPANQQNNISVSADKKPTNSTNKHNVFISYNHKDKEIANKLKDKLRENNIDVTIDSEKMNAGEDIKEFIENCVKNTNITLSIVSKRSILSAWVAMETINTLYHEKTAESKKYIACYIEDDFFKRNFTDDALDLIDNEISEIRDLITKRMEKGRNIRDLQNELSRFTDLNNNIDEIIRRLRESLCVDIKDENLEKNFNVILKAIAT